MEHDQLVTPNMYHVMSSYLTCEAATVSHSGTPIAWPVTGVWRPDDQAFAFSTSIGFPRKAFNIRREPRVALLFSDPTGSGLDRAGQVLVQGEAQCTDEIVTSFSQNADVWQRIAQTQPSSRALSSSRLVRRLMDVYYMRLFITVAPTTVTTREPLPETARQVSFSAVPDIPPAIAGEIGGFPSAVLASLDDDGHATLARVVPEPTDDGLMLPGTDARPGRASLLFHRHDELLAGQRSFVVVGELVERASGLALRPDRVADGIQSGGMLSQISMARGLRRRAQAYLDKRGLDRPQVAWHELEEIYAGIDAASAAR